MGETEDVMGKRKRKRKRKREDFAVHFVIGSSPEFMVDFRRRWT